ncbi:MAG: hypothetical protein ACTSR2_01120 [Candidatus Hodarchaeales archaeon]
MTNILIEMIQEINLATGGWFGTLLPFTTMIIAFISSKSDDMISKLFISSLSGSIVALVGMLTGVTNISIFGIHVFITIAMFIAGMM